MIESISWPIRYKRSFLSSRYFERHWDMRISSFVLFLSSLISIRNEKSNLLEIWEISLINRWCFTGGNLITISDVFVSFISFEKKAHRFDGFEWTFEKEKWREKKASQSSDETITNCDGQFLHSEREIDGLVRFDISNSRSITKSLN